MNEMRQDKNGFYIYAQPKGEFNLEDMYAALEGLKNPKLPRKLRLLENATETIANFNQSALPQLVLKMNEVAKEYVYIHHAVVHHHPLNTAYSIIVKDLNKNSNYLLRVFNTEKAAQQWLQLAPL